MDLSNDKVADGAKSDCALLVSFFDCSYSNWAIIKSGLFFSESFIAEFNSIGKLVWNIDDFFNIKEKQSFNINYFFVHGFVSNSLTYVNTIENLIHYFECYDYSNKELKLIVSAFRKVWKYFIKFKWNYYLSQSKVFCIKS